MTLQCLFARSLRDTPPGFKGCHPTLLNVGQTHPSKWHVLEWRQELEGGGGEGEGEGLEGITFISNHDGWIGIIMPYKK